MGTVPCPVPHARCVSTHRNVQITPGSPMNLHQLNTPSKKAAPRGRHRRRPHRVRAGGGEGSAKNTDPPPKRNVGTLQEVPRTFKTPATYGTAKCLPVLVRPQLTRRRPRHVPSPQYGLNSRLRGPPALQSWVTEDTRHVFPGRAKSRDPHAGRLRAKWCVCPAPRPGLPLVLPGPSRSSQCPPVAPITHPHGSSFLLRWRF